jgi:hypothetical protein
MSEDSRFRDEMREAMTQIQENPAGRPISKSQSILGVILRFTIIVLYVPLLLKYFFPYSPQIFTWINFGFGAFEFFFPGYAVSILSIVTTIVLLFIVPILLFPISPYKKNRFVSKIFSWYLILFFIIILASILQSAITEPESRVGSMYGSGFKESFSGIIIMYNKIVCSMNPDCVTQMQNQKEATTDTSAKFEIKPITTIEQNIPRDYAIIQAQFEKIKYSMTTQNNLEIIGFSCFYENDKKPFYIQDISSLSYLKEKSGEYSFQPTFSCKNFPQINFEPQQTQKTITITTKVGVKVKAYIVQKIPSVSTEYILSNSNKEPLDTFYKEYYSEEIAKYPELSYDLVKPNLPVDVSINEETLKQFPIITGTKDSTEIDYTLKISAKSNNFGTLFKARLVSEEIVLPSIISKYLITDYGQVSVPIWNDITIDPTSVQNNYFISLRILPNTELMLDNPITQELKIPIELYFEKEIKTPVIIKNSINTESNTNTQELINNPNAIPTSNG